MLIEGKKRNGLQENHCIGIIFAFDGIKAFFFKSFFLFSSLLIGGATAILM